MLRSVATLEAQLDVAKLRAQFPALVAGGSKRIFADAPGGTQVPAAVIAAMSHYLAASNANTGGAFPTSAATEATIDAARLATADFLGGAPEDIVFGPNMTTLSFALARSLEHTLGAGDEIVVTELDHDANIAPWLAAAEQTGAAVRTVGLRAPRCTIDLDDFASALGPRTRVVAFTLASNAVGTITAAREMVELTRDTNAIVVVDAVHFAQHQRVDVASLGADVVFCSPYKFFGPHLGVMWARREFLETLRVYKVRPASSAVPESWETGTRNHEALAGLTAAIDYLAALGFDTRAGAGSRRAAIGHAFDAIVGYESELSRRFLVGISDLDGVALYGLTGPDETRKRTPTFALSFAKLVPRQAATELGARGIYVWDGNYYALAIMEALGLEASGGAVRIGFCHYNTIEEVDRVVAEVGDLSRS
jgi:cysteine desulfurase family protein (TIGR01976 family)